MTPQNAPLSLGLLLKNTGILLVPPDVQKEEDDGYLLTFVHDISNVCHFLFFLSTLTHLALFLCRLPPFLLIYPLHGCSLSWLTSSPISSDFFSIVFLAQTPMERCRRMKTMRPLLSAFSVEKWYGSAHQRSRCYSLGCRRVGFESDGSHYILFRGIYFFFVILSILFCCSSDFINTLSQKFECSIVLSQAIDLSCCKDSLQPNSS